MPDQERAEGPHYWIADTEVMAQLILEWMHATAEGSYRLLMEQGDKIAIDLAVRRANATLEAIEKALETSNGVLTRVDTKLVTTLVNDVPDDVTKGEK